MSKKFLKTYQKKRDFSRTPEPKGSQLASSNSQKFVIHKHASRALHYDLRLEDEGVLKSWAIPKGPSVDPQKKQLALETEDHPLEYGEIEGVW